MSRGPFEEHTKVCFATYCLLSLELVALFQFTSCEDTNCAMRLLWLASPCIAATAVYMTKNLVNERSTAHVDSCLHTIYTAPVSVVLVVLGHLVIWTRRYFSIPSENDMDFIECAIHFAMSFYVLSECEFYPLYWITHRHGQPLNFRLFFKAYCAPDNDPAFEQSRDCITYHFGVPRLELPPRDGWLSRDTLTRHTTDLFVFSLPFFLAMACLTYPIKRLINPDLNNADVFASDSRLLSALFTPKNALSCWLAVKLQRPIRLLNRMLFWSIVDCIAKVWKWRKTTVLPR